MTLIVLAIMVTTPKAEAGLLEATAKPESEVYVLLHCQRLATLISPNSERLLPGDVTVVTVRKLLSGAEDQMERGRCAMLVVFVSLGHAAEQTDSLLTLCSTLR